MIPRVRRSLTVALALAGAPLTVLAAQGDLVDLVPAETYSVVHGVTDPACAIPDQYSDEVIDAIVDARFDDWALDTIVALGARDTDREELDSIRNVVGSLLGMVRWRDFVANEYVYAESTLPFAPGVPVPSYLLMSRPPQGRTAELEASVSGLLASISAIARDDITYHVRDEALPHLYALSIPEAGDLSVLQIAFTSDTVIVGMGADYFEQAVLLVAGGEGRRLTAQPVWERAFAGLPARGSTRTFVDTRTMMSGLQGIFGFIAQREHDARYWQSLVNDAFHLVDFVDTVASTTHCDGTDVITESITRFQGDAVEQNPLYALQPGPASGELLEYVPADVVSFSMSGATDVRPLWGYVLDRLRDYWPQAEDALWSLEVAEAFIDLDIEDDVLSWLGSESVSIELPSTRRGATPGSTDSITLMRLENPAAARKVLDRFDAVFQTAAPRLMEKLNEELERNGVPFLQNVRVDIGPATGLYPMLSRLQVRVGALPIPELTFGVLGNLFIVTSSDDALETCMAVAAGELDGLWEHDLLADVATREGISTASLVPYGRQMAQTQAIVAGITGGLAGMGQSLGGQTPREAKVMINAVAELVPRIQGVLGVVDFLDTGASYGELREDGMAHYERKLVRLLEPQARPSYVADGGR